MRSRSIDYLTVNCRIHCPVSYDVWAFKHSPPPNHIATHNCNPDEGHSHCCSPLTRDIPNETVITPPCCFPSSPPHPLTLFHFFDRNIPLQRLSRSTMRNSITPMPIQDYSYSSNLLSVKFLFSFLSPCSKVPFNRHQFKLVLDLHF
jgi:hypothetical protein